MKYFIFLVLLFPLHKLSAQTNCSAENIKIAEIKESNIQDRQMAVSAGNYLYLGTKVSYDSTGSLYRTDGKSNSLRLTARVVTDSSYTVKENYDFVFSIYSAGKYIFFVAMDDEHGFELWATDTTGYETHLVKEFTKERNDISYLSSQGSFNNELYLIHRENSLWKTDGTGKGTQLLKENKKDNSVYFATPASNQVYFFTESSKSVELWATKGLKKNTKRIMKLLNYSFENTEYHVPATYGNMISFLLKNKEGKYVLLASDGTKKGTYPLKTLNTYSHYYYYTTVSYGNQLYFTVADEKGRTNEIWKTNGTVDGTKKILALDSNARITHLTIGGNKLYYFSNNVSKKKYGQVSLCSFDLIIEKQHSEIPIQLSSAFIFAPHYKMVYTGGYVYFQDYQYEKEIWRSDGTEKGTCVISGKNNYDYNPAKIIGTHEGSFYFSETYNYKDFLLRTPDPAVINK